MNVSGEAATFNPGAETDRVDALRRGIDQILIDNFDNVSSLLPIRDTGESRETFIRVVGGSMKSDANVRGSQLSIVDVSYPNMDGDRSLTISINDHKFLLDGSGIRRIDERLGDPSEDNDALSRVSGIINPSEDVQVRWDPLLSRMKANAELAVNPRWDYMDRSN